jgi:prepilin-type N-terminal cleavage/methylation domain-containing protein
METLRLHPKQNRQAGFSILELLIAITVLAVGLSAMAALVASSLAGTEKARFMALSTTLASEKLEDLNRWPSIDSHVATGGSLSTDTTVGSIRYYDDIDLSNTTGQVSETVATSSGYSSVIHKSTGEVIPSSNSAAPSGSGTIGFHRRWLVEANPVVNSITLTGSRRVTVVVSSQNINPPVSFQLSLVRP